MSIKTINATLLVVTVVGAVLAYRAGNEYRQLRAAYERLDALVGLPLQDPTKIHVRALATGEDQCFSWRIYVPPGVDVRWRSNLYHDVTWRSYGDTLNRVAMVQLGENSCGTLCIISLGNGGSGKSFLYGDDLPDLLRTRWEEVRVEQLGANNVAIVGTDELVTLLRLTPSDALKADLVRRVESSQREEIREALLVTEFGAVEAFRHAEASK